MSALYLYDTATREVGVFSPLKPGEVSMYVCGATVQGAPHIGHVRSAINFDILRRWLTHNDYNVTFVRNVTDIDDKIIKRAAELGEFWESLTTRFISACLEDLQSLYVLPAESYPRATAYIGEMQSLIAALIQKGAAYVSEGDVYFSLAAFPEYGKLSKKILLYQPHIF